MSAGPLVYGIFTVDCFDRFFNKKQLFHVACLKLLISKLLGYAIVGLSTIVKVPQIYNIIKSGSAEGVSLSMFIFETFGYTISVAYNLHFKYPFSTYGENVFIWIQNVILIYLLVSYNKSFNSKFAAGIALYIVGATSLFMGLFAENIMQSIQTISIFIFIASRIPQIRENYKNGSTGQLAFLTCFLNFGGSIARLFTVLTEVDDAVVLLSVCSGAIFNGIILFQIFYYWNSTIKKTQ